MIRRVGHILLLLVLSVATLSAQEQHYDIEEISVLGSRPIRDIGVTKSHIDSTSLRHTISLSMADVLSFNSAVYVKSSGRASLSTVAFRGTSPSHTQVLWNGVKINNPMMGSTDFSTIPAYFVDDATLLHGSSSIDETSGGLGGAISLSTKPKVYNGLDLQYIQGVGSFSTLDEYLRVGWGNSRWQLSTRVAVSTSENDFHYTNYDKRMNIYDDDMNIVAQYYPEEYNKSGSWADMHILQEVYFMPKAGHRLSLNMWYTNSNRELQMLSTDYASDSEYDNRQREQDVRSVVAWQYIARNVELNARAGYLYTAIAYDYKREVRDGVMVPMTEARSFVHTLYGNFSAEYSPTTRLLLKGDVQLNQHFATSRDRSVILQDGGEGIVGYRKARVEGSVALSAKWRPIDRMGISFVLREELVATELTPLIPALFVEAELSRRGNIIAKGSISRNYRYPTLNDLYFLPGGNPDLKSERGWSYDLGIESSGALTSWLQGSAKVTWFDSYIHDWILWLPTTKGYFSPRNIKDVHSYGIEAALGARIALPKEWSIALDGNVAWTPSVNCGEPLSEADLSVGKQLPYVPQFTATLTGVLKWRGWGFSYMWCHYSERYTMSSNDISISGRLPKYYMSNIALEKSLSLKRVDLQFKGVVNNLFNEKYLSVMSHPMPGINFQIFVGVTPKLR